MDQWEINVLEILLTNRVPPNGKKGQNWTFLKCIILPKMVLIFLRKYLINASEEFNGKKSRKFENLVHTISFDLSFFHLFIVYLLGMRLQNQEQKGFNFTISIVTIKKNLFNKSCSKYFW